MLKKISKGFTLIELLIVIAIIAILATVGVLSYTGQKDKAIVATLKSNLSEAVNAANACSVDSLTPITPAIDAIICSGSTVVPTAKWPNLSKTQGSWIYTSWTTAPVTGATNLCANGTTTLCAVGNMTTTAPTISGGTVTSATRAAVCTLGAGSCSYFGDTAFTQ